VKTKDEVRSLSGSEFETYVARILQQHGWRVSSTPTTGDQGVDVIASKNGRKVVIQAKRYSASVGNHAVQAPKTFLIRATTYLPHKSPI
jgi:HJR/Mrr/RecB family endonuclease